MAIRFLYMTAAVHHAARQAFDGIPRVLRASRYQRSHSSDRLSTGRIFMAKRRKERPSGAALRPSRSALRRPRGSGQEKKSIALLARELDETRQSDYRWIT